MSVTLASAPTAFGQSNPEHEAQQLFEEGKRLMSAGAYPAACSKFAASLRLDAGVGTMLYLAECFERNGQTASAWEQFRDAAALAAAGSDAREKVARARAAGLEPRLSKLVIRVSKDANGMTIKRDGIVVERSLWEKQLPVDPGSHSIVAAAPRMKDWRAAVDVGADAAVVIVTVPALVAETDAPALSAGPKATPAATDTEDLDPHRGRTQRFFGGAVALGGLAAIGLGAYLGVRAKSAWDAAASRCPGACDAQGFDERIDARRTATWSTVSFGIGAAAGLVGALLFFTAPRSTSWSGFRSMHLSPVAVGAFVPGVGIAGTF